MNENSSNAMPIHGCETKLNLNYHDQLHLTERWRCYWRCAAVTYIITLETHTTTHRSVYYKLKRFRKDHDKLLQEFTHSLQHNAVVNHHTGKQVNNPVQSSVTNQPTWLPANR